MNVKTIAQAIMHLALLPAVLPPGRLFGQTNPAPGQLIAWHAAAAGGAAALDRHTSIERTGEAVIEAHGITGVYRVRRASRPDRYLYEMSLGSVGSVTRGFDGSRGWDVGPMSPEPRFLEGSELESRIRAASFRADLRESELALPMETMGRGAWEGCECWEVRVTLGSGSVRRDFYDVTSKLYHGSVDSVGGLERITVIARYESFDGVLLPTVILQRLPQFETVIRITETSFDMVSDAVFLTPGAGGAR